MTKLNYFGKAYTATIERGILPLLCHRSLVKTPIYGHSYVSKRTRWQFFLQNVTMAPPNAFKRLQLSFSGLFWPWRLTLEKLKGRRWDIADLTFKPPRWSVRRRRSPLYGVVMCLLPNGKHTKYSFLRPPYLQSTGQDHSRNAIFILGSFSQFCHFHHKTILKPRRSTLASRKGPRPPKSRPVYC